MSTPFSDELKKDWLTYATRDLEHSTAQTLSIPLGVGIMLVLVVTGFFNDPNILTFFQFMAIVAATVTVPFWHIRIRAHLAKRRMAAQGVTRQSERYRFTKQIIELTGASEDDAWTLSRAFAFKYRPLKQSIAEPSSGKMLIVNDDLNIEIVRPVLLSVSI